MVPEKHHCLECGSSSIKRNGHTHYGKQNYRCTDCGRQFVEGGSDWFVSDRDRDLVDRLLLERISLAGICRVVGVSASWLCKYVAQLYASLPDDLGAKAEIPDLEDWLANRLDEEIGRLGVIKKIRLHFKRQRQ
jgi:hypothetical protein